MINRIITGIYKRNIPQKIFNKLKRKLPQFDDVDDYVQEMYLILLETPPDKLIDLHNQNRVDDYFARICINQLVNKNSTLHKKLQTNWNKTEINADTIDYELLREEFDSKPTIAIGTETEE